MAKLKGCRLDFIFHHVGPFHFEIFKIHLKYIRSANEVENCRFRWVSLSLDYLCTLRTASDVTRRLGRLPKSLVDSYQQLYQQNVKTYDVEDLERLDLALGMRFLPERPPADIFTQLIFWDDNEESIEDEHQQGMLQ